MENNKEKKHLSIDKKMLICFIEFWIVCFLYLLLKIIPFNSLNKKTVFYDIIMIIALIISIFGIGFLIFNHFKKDLIKEKFKKSLYNILSFFIVLPICVVITTFIFNYFFIFTEVSGTSMLPNISNEDELVLFYDRDLEINDIIVIDVNKKHYLNVNENKYYVKRVVGLPGDKIKFKNNLDETLIYINDSLYDQSYYKDLSYKNFGINEYLNNSSSGIKLEADGRVIFRYLTADKEVESCYVIPEGYYFVLGDNRMNSKDSRSIGLIRKQDVVGSIKYRVGKFIFDWRKVV